MQVPMNNYLTENLHYLLNTHGFSNAMMKKEMVSLMMPISGKEQETISLLSH